jgi:hypothetical protein
MIAKSRPPIGIAAISQLNDWPFAMSVTALESMVEERQSPGFSTSWRETGKQ